MKIVEPQLGSAIPDCADTPGEGDGDAIELLTGINQSLFTVFFDEGCDGLSDFKLVRVRVWRLYFLQLLNCSGAQLEVLLERGEP